MTKYTVENINQAARHDPAGYVRQCSKNYIKTVEKAAAALLSANKKLILLAGPSSSGKTTTAHILANTIEKNGCEAKTISLDDFYLAGLENYPLNSDGTYDFESIDALDMPLIGKCFGEILESRKTQLPVFDFGTHSRKSETRPFEISENGVVIVEGIHGLNPAIVADLPVSGIAKVYVSVSSRVFDNEHDENDVALLNKRGLRLIRRLVRDKNFRSTSAYDTFAIWGSVLYGENKNIFPYRTNADIKLDSFHPCEPCLFAPEAQKLLAELEGTQFAEQASVLKNAVNRFEVIDKNCLTEDSLLCEFLGRP
ncbi:MAG: nucleoside kinase [Clostridia bacterium]|nr:nucleoside kinase [Clostridia bacterium]MBQ4244564.1 nucleoside kinase [Clostridia bacterium]